MHVNAIVSYGCALSRQNPKPDLKQRNSYLNERINNHKTKGDRWFRGSPAKIVVLSDMSSNFIMIGIKGLI